MDNVVFLSRFLAFFVIGFFVLKVYFKFRRLRIERNADKLLKELKRREKEDK